MRIAIVDAGPLISVADAGDPRHRQALAVLERPDLERVVPALVAAEAAYLIGERLGPRAESRFFLGIADLVVEAPPPDDCARIAALIDRYSDFPLGGADASVVALAERLRTPLVVTFDRRHFSAVRPRHCEALELLPE